MRRPFVVGNWKMNHLLADARALMTALREGLAGNTSVDVGIAPSAVLLMPMCRAVAESIIQLGAQDSYCQASGAFTGEIAPPMLVDAGCKFVIIGHSERRAIFGESGELLAKKVQAALSAGLDVIYCIGETLEQREGGRTEAVLQQQLSEVMAAELEWQRVTIAYEPVWAIGTGRTATPDQAQTTHRFVRGWVNRKYGDAASAAMRILYGGSVKPSNAEELMDMADIDGALVGGASLEADDFLAIIRAATPDID